MSEGRRCPDGEALVGYLYDEADLAERARVEAHLAICTLCRDEIAALGGVRTTLAEWKPPAQALGFRLVRDPVVVPLRRPWYSVPRWAQAAAAVLVLAVAVAVAKLDVRYEQGAVVIRTGWHTGADAAGRQVAAGAPWRADLAALEQQLRGDFRAGLAAARPVSTSVPPLSDEEFARRVDVALHSGRVQVLPVPGMNDEQLIEKVKSLVQASEERQRRELALRLLQVNGDFEARQLQYLASIRQGFRQIENRTGLDSERINFLMRRVSQEK